MIVTINTDASLDHHSKRGGWAFWIVSDLGRLRGSGVFKEVIAHSHEAEFKAIINAMWYLSEKSGWEGIDWIIVNTDNQEVFEMINDKPTRQWAYDLKIDFVRLCMKVGARKAQARKVKAHSGIDEKRKFVNHWCDREAKRARLLSNKK